MGFIQMKLRKRMRIKIADTKRKREAQAEHKVWLESQGLDDKTLRRSVKDFKGYDIPNYTPLATKKNICSTRENVNCLVLA